MPAPELWHIERSLITPKVELRFRPNDGARIVSLRNRQTGREWLVPAEHEPRPSYGDKYTSARRVYGWDEMLGTTEPTDDIPDHGEVWAVPWRESPALSTDGLRHEVTGRVLPLTLVREILPTATGISFRYQLVNRGSTRCVAYWGAHPFFAVGRSANIVFDLQDVHARIDIPSSQSGKLDWPAVLRAADALRDGEFMKAWVRIPERGSLTVIDGQDRLRIGWEGRATEHLAVVWDRCRFASVPALAIEPMTAAADTPEAGPCLVLEAKAHADWRLDIDLL